MPMNARVDITAPRSGQIAAWAAGALTREFPEDVARAAKVALIDVVGCAIGAWDEECVRPVRKVVESWRAPGTAQIIRGGRTNAALAALACWQALVGDWRRPTPRLAIDYRTSKVTV